MIKSIWTWIGLLSLAIVTTACGGSSGSGGSDEVMTLIFDGSPVISGSGTTRGAGNSCGTFLSTGSDPVTINQIAVLNDMGADGNVKFLIFNHDSGETRVFESAPKSFPVAIDDEITWKNSDPMSFVLEANTQYDIGGIADVAARWGLDPTSRTENGITSIVGNPNFNDFADPTSSAHAGNICAIQLFQLQPES